MALAEMDIIRNGNYDTVFDGADEKAVVKLAVQIAAQAKGRKITGPYKLTMEVVRPDKRKRDLDNLLKAASDALVSAGILEDHHCEWIDARWVKEGPECLLIVEEIK